VWLGLEPHFKLYLVQPMSNAAPRGRKMDFADAIRLIKRFQANELRLSFVPEAEQRRWRELTRTRTSLLRDRVCVHNHIEALLEEGQIKLSSVVSNLLGVSGRRILKALIDGEQDPEKLAGLGHGRLRAPRAVLAEALEGNLHPVDRTILDLHLQRVELLDKQILRLEQEVHEAQSKHLQAIHRLCAIPGVGLPAAEQILAEVGPEAKTFATASRLASWAGLCPGRQESAGISRSNRSPKGNVALRRLLTQVAWASVRVKDCWFEGLFRRWVPRLGPQKAIWAVAHRILAVIWKILHEGVEYVEFGPSQNPAARDLM
jgi:transposase